MSSPSRAVSRAIGSVLIEATGGAAIAVIITGADHYGLEAAREVPEPWQRFLVPVHHLDQVGEQSLLLISLRNFDLVEVDPVG